LLHEPPEAADWTLSDIAVEWAREVAGYELDEWQEWLVRWTFARRRDGLWAARDVGAEVTRQSGKNIWLEVVELVGVFEFRDRLITHSAHRADVSHEHFLSMRARIESSDALMGMMPRTRSNDGFITTNGNESIELDSKARILFKARAKASGRGPRPQKIVFDEALVLVDGQVGSMAPGISADIDPADRDAWYRVNPSLGYGRMTEESLKANQKLMSAAEYLREHLGVPELPEDAEPKVIADDVWAALTDRGSKIESHHCIALDVSPDRRHAAFGAAGRRADGGLHVEAFEHRPRTDWVLGVAKASWDLLKIPIRIQTGSPAASFIAPLRQARVEVVEVSQAEHAEAVGQVLDAVSSGLLRHLGGATLTAAVGGAALRMTGDVNLWARRNTRVDITPLVAVTLAAGGVPAMTAKGLFVAVT
jgi:hypothetical protein